jgi:hypothetical protein
LSTSSTAKPLNAFVLVNMSVRTRSGAQIHRSNSSGSPNASASTLVFDSSTGCSG